MKRTLNLALIGALLLGLLATWLAPKLISYWYAPPEVAGANNVPNCTPYVTAAMHNLVVTQIVGTVLGLVVGLLIGVAMRPRPASPPPAAPPPAAAPPAAPPAR